MQGPTVVLKGYYGFGNLGDDLLLMICCKWIKQVFPESTLIVSTASPSCTYIHKLTENKIDRIISLEPEVNADLIIHGGGGTYFDFKTGRWQFLILNSAIRLIGIGNFGKLLRLFRASKGKFQNPLSTRLALGIGIGRFSSKSEKYYSKAAELAGFDLIVTRDQISFQELKRKQLKGLIWNATDLAFVKHSWLLVDNFEKQSSGKNVGFVLRKWDQEPDYLQILQKVVNQLKSLGYTISIFFFEKEHDKTIEPMFEQYTRHFWEPNNTELTSYMALINNQDVLITSRAHGVIIGAALGIPTVCIGIEPKLKSFHEMVPNSSVFIELPLSTHGLIEAINKATSISKENIKVDFRHQSALMHSTMEKVTEWLLQTIGINGND